jgi:F0F1-type ATP synthase assembly protein I
MLQPRSGETRAAPPPHADPWVSLSLLLLGLTVVGLVLGGVLAVYTWTTPRAEQPLFLIVLGLFGAALAIQVIAAAARRARTGPR